MTPPPHTSQTAMSHTIGTASTIDGTCDDASTLFNESVPLGEILDAHIAKLRKLKLLKFLMNHLLHLPRLLKEYHLTYLTHHLCLMKSLLESLWLMMVQMV